MTREDMEQLTDMIGQRIKAELGEPYKMPPGMTDIIRKEASYGGNVHFRTPIGFGQFPLLADFTLRPDGSMSIVWADINGRPLWKQIFTT